MEKTQRGRAVLDGALIALGSAVAAFALSAFLVPAQIVVGGATGAATIIHYLSGWPVGLISFIINVPLFIVGWRSVGRAFALKSFAAMTLMSIVLDAVPAVRLTEDMVLGTLYGGVLLGIGLGLVLRSGASTGGSDLAAQLLRHPFPQLSVSTLLFVVDFVIIAASALFFGAEQALYALLALFISIRIIDFFVDGISAGRSFWIISKNHAEIARRIAHELERGATHIPAVGSYSGHGRTMLLCIVSRSEVVALKRIVHQVDPEAFMMIAEAGEVLGEGFSPHK